MSQDAIRKTTWSSAYKAFLLDKNENVFLKIAPLALLLGSPEIIISNVIPIVGEITDIGALTLAAIIVFRTIIAVRRHR